MIRSVIVISCRAWQSICQKVLSCLRLAAGMHIPKGCITPWGRLLLLLRGRALCAKAQRLRYRYAQHPIVFMAMCMSCCGVCQIVGGAGQDAGTIQVLPTYLHRGCAMEVQLEALHALYNMCKISPTRQEAAALAGLVPLLVKLAATSLPEPPSMPQPPAPSGADPSSLPSSAEDVATMSGRAPQPLRPLAVSLLCGMAHSTHRTRHELWAHNVVALLLELLQEEVMPAHQNPACAASVQLPQSVSEVLWPPFGWAHGVNCRLCQAAPVRDIPCNSTYQKEKEENKEKRKITGKIK